MKKHIILALCACVALNVMAGDEKHWTQENTGNLKALHKVYELIAKKEYVKAEKARMALKEKLDKQNAKDAGKNIDYVKNLYPLWDLAEVLQHSIKLDPIKDPDKVVNYCPLCAYETYEKVVKSNIYVNEARGWLASEKINMGFAVIESQVNAALMDYACTENDEETYGKVYAALKDTQYASELLKRKDNAGYRTAMNAESITGYEYYLTNYPQGEHFKEIHQLRDDLAYKRADKSPEGLSEFLKKYPDAYNYSTVENEMYFKALTLSKDTNTVASYTNYMKTYPNSPYCGEAQDIIYKLAYDDALKSGQVRELKEYLAKYPNSYYTSEIMKQIGSTESEQLISEYASYRDYLIYEKDHGGNGDPKIERIYRNLIYMENHAHRMGFRGLVRFVNETVEAGGKKQTVQMIFNSNGLMQERNPSNGASIKYNNYWSSNGWVERGIGAKTFTYTYKDGLVSARIAGGQNLVYRYNGLALAGMKEYVNNKLQNETTFNEATTQPQKIVGQQKEIINDFNDKGDVSTQTEKIKGVTSVYTFEYEYDKRGNWTKCVKKKDGKVLETRTRTITYFKRTADDSTFEF